MKLLVHSDVRAATERYPDVRKQIECWSAVVTAATWQHVMDVRQAYNSAKAVGDFTVFNIKGNKYRLIVRINYEDQTIYCKKLLTGAEYDTGQWINDPHF